MNLEHNAWADEDDEFKEFDPDDLPELDEAVRVLFPSLREPLAGAPNVAHYRREGAELEYEVEMVERLQRVSEMTGYNDYLTTYSLL